MAATSLKNYEVDGLMAAYHEVRQAIMSAIGRRFVLPAHEHEHECPICLTGIIEGESVMSCEQGCKQPVHLSCMSAYAESLRSTRDKLCCPLCRHPWADSQHPRTSLHTHAQLVSPVLPRRSLVANFRAADDAILLPDTPSLPAEDLRRVRAWVIVFGERLVSCLHASGWGARETALRNMHSMLASDLAKPDTCHHDWATVNVTAEILARTSRDPVFKVYDATLSVLCILTGVCAHVKRHRRIREPCLQLVLGTVFIFTMPARWLLR